VEVNVTNTGDRAGDEVVQLYLTDMYASVKTRVMELKDFDRVTLAPGETRKVSFLLKPYQLSLLNDKMDRVVESGEFKISVGGKSPSFNAGDKIKDSVGYLSDTDGLSEIIDYPKSYSADFNLSYIGLEENLVYNKRRVAVKVQNNGNIMDVGKVNLFADGVSTGEIHHYELAPGEGKVILFDLDKKMNIKELTFTIKYKSINIKL